MSRGAHAFDAHLAGRHRVGQIFRILCFASILFALVILCVLLIGLIWKSWGIITWSFLNSPDSWRASRAGIQSGLWGTLWLTLLTAICCVPVGVGAAVYLEEYASPNRLTRFIQLNIANLAGVPSIVYGIFGLTLFVRGMSLGRTLAAAALTMSLLILPVVIIATQEALRSIPATLRHAAYALGATKWQTIRHQVIPAAMPGILTGVILALSRAAGETAPLVMIGGLSYWSSTPGDIKSLHDFFTHPQSILQAPWDQFTAMPLAIYNWALKEDEEFQRLAAAGIVVLLAMLLLMNTAAIVIRHRFQKHVRW